MITLIVLFLLAVIIIFIALCALGVIASALSGVIFIIIDVAIAVSILGLIFGGKKDKKEKK